MGRTINLTAEYDTINASDNRDWMLHAACRHPNPNPTPTEIRERAALFFPERSPGPGSETKMRQASAAAKAICHTCPVQEDCEDHRTRYDINHGTWAGRTELDREGAYASIQGKNHQR